MNPKAFQRVLLAILFTFSIYVLVACQAEEKMTTIGIINYVPAMEPVLDGFKEGMVDLGYIEGENITYTYEDANGNRDELARIAKKFIESNFDIILALSTPAAVAAKEATVENKIPVIFAPVTNPLAADLVETISKPGGNVTGIMNGTSESRRLGWLLELNPEMEQVYIPYNPEDNSAMTALQAAQAAARELGIELVIQEAIDHTSMTDAINNIPEGIDAVFMLPDSLAIEHIDEFVAATIERQLPFSGPTTAQVEDGALITFGIDFLSVGKQAARLADQILRGADPATLPVEEGQFFLVINLKTAEAINLESIIGQESFDDILSQADRIIRPSP